MIRLKRTYDPPARADGRRILVERLWPRGMKKEGLAGGCLAERGCAQHRTAAVVRSSRGAVERVPATLQERAEQKARCLGADSRCQQTGHRDPALQRP